jgi:predicted lipoprotein with Yx(FWY)xxD motif
VRFRALLIVPLAVLAAACGSSSSNTGTASAPPTSTTRTTVSGVPAGLSTRKLSGLGQVLVNESGRTLYTFTPEKGGKIACTGSCATLWPPLTTTEQTPSISSTLVHPNLVGTVADPSGGKIVTYAGWPLHTYTPDTQAGTANGQGVDGKWYVIAPSGQVVTKSAGSSSSSSSGGSTY